MTIRKIEVPISGKHSFDGLLDAARIVALCFDAQIDIRFIRPSASDAALYDAGFGYASASLIDQIEKEGVAASASARKSYDVWCQRHDGLPRINWHDEEGQIGAVVAHRGCVADLIMLKRANAKETALDEPFEAAVFGAGRLAMVVDETLSANFLDHVMVAWNESTQSSRAVAQALPFLTKAKRVSIFSVSEVAEEATDVAGLIDYLALHGVTASPIVVGPVDGPIAPALLKVARDTQVTALVMGAYTHGRVRQMLFGGVTQHMLTTPGIPVLFAH